MSKGCPKGFWIGLAVVFFLTTLTGSGYTIWRELWSLRLTPDVILQRYTSLFRTVFQQGVFEEEYFQNNIQYVPVNTTVDRYRCTVDCNATRSGPASSRTSSGMIFHHACCETSIVFRSMETMINIMNKEKKVAQFGDKRQYFKFESCSHIRGFGYGECRQQIRGEFTTAVTVDDDLDDNDQNKYRIEWVRVPGSCKCMNT